jgi:hypothetical protein
MSVNYAKRFDRSGNLYSLLKYGLISATKLEIKFTIRKEKKPSAWRKHGFPRHFHPSANSPHAYMDRTGQSTAILAKYKKRYLNYL